MSETTFDYKYLVCVRLEKDGDTVKNKKVEKFMEIDPAVSKALYTDSLMYDVVEDESKNSRKHMNLFSAFMVSTQLLESVNSTEFMTCLFKTNTKLNELQLKNIVSKCDMDILEKARYVP